MIFENLRLIGERFNREGILWAVGASVMLNQYGLVYRPNDIDLMVDINDIDKVDCILKELGNKKYREKVEEYTTEYFYEYVINGSDVDVMAGLAINFCGGSYRYIFDKSSIARIVDIDGVDIPLTSLEDWYVLYQVIPNREKKIVMIENYLKDNGITRIDLLKRALTRELPKEVRERIEKLIEFNCKC